MTAQRRTAVLNALAIVAFAGTLVACGVKGELESPPRPNLTDTKTDAGAAAEVTTETKTVAKANTKTTAKAGTKTSATGARTTAADVLAAQPESRALSEQSTIQSKGYPSVLPRMPPEEWQKYRQETDAQKAKKRTKVKDDTPFFLDPIL